VAIGLLIVFMLYGSRIAAEAAIKSAATNLWPFPECI
jgi:hypothetical protein